ncbi:holin [Streptomyces sp. NPDC046332]|uniref:holin n=1 Tax=unclassified Streptomyces TaxID=2593676 RepID=UPI0033E9436F
MSQYLKDLAERVLGVFLTTLAGLALAAEPFNLLTFDWGTALGASGSAAVLALVVGLAARFKGDPDSAGLSR